MNTPELQLITPSSLATKLATETYSLVSDILSGKYSPRFSLYRITANAISLHAAAEFLKSTQPGAESYSALIPLSDVKDVLTRALEQTAAITEPRVHAQALVSSLAQYSTPIAQTTSEIHFCLAEGRYSDLADIFIENAAEYFSKALTNQFTFETYECKTDLSIEIDAFGCLLSDIAKALQAAIDLCYHRNVAADATSDLSDFMRKLA